MAFGYGPDQPAVYVHSCHRGCAHRTPSNAWTTNVSTLKLPMEMTFGSGVSDVLKTVLVFRGKVLCEGGKKRRDFGYSSFLITMDCEDSVSSLFSVMCSPSLTQGSPP